jgi:hypothetical protein
LADSEIEEPQPGASAALPSPSISELRLPDELEGDETQTQQGGEVWPQGFEGGYQTTLHALGVQPALLIVDGQLVNVLII